MANLSPALGSPDPAQDSQITVLMGNHISLCVVSKCTPVTNSFMRGLGSCNVLYPLELTAMNTGNLKVAVAYDVPYVRQERKLKGIAHQHFLILLRYQDAINLLQLKRFRSQLFQDKLL